MNEEKTFKVGDRVYVDEAWEDQAGGFHDATGEVIDVLPEDEKNGVEYRIKFDDETVQGYIGFCSWEPWQMEDEENG